MPQIGSTGYFVDNLGNGVWSIRVPAAGGHHSFNVNAGDQIFDMNPPKRDRMIFALACESLGARTWLQASQLPPATLATRIGAILTTLSQSVGGG